VTRTLGYFVAGSLAGSAALAAVYWQLYQTYGATCVAVAAPVCIIPTLLSLMLALWARDKKAPDQLMSVVGGMGLRMGAALLLGIAIFKTVPQFQESRERSLVYWSAILICYMGSLGWETILTARATKSTAMKATPAANGAGE
jgi:hypothetical protein